ncbi:MAG: NAD(P)H-dependent oxidoreductase [Myxococcales bacterium]|nr:NAD(P)H-dependent oxidoreductase [Myxococcales bacterium]
MSHDEDWVDVGAVDELEKRELQPVLAKRTRLALTYRAGKFTAISSACNHVGGPLAEGKLVGDYVECPWHYWKFHHATGRGEPGFESDAVPAYAVKVENGRVLVDLGSATRRHKSPHEQHPLARTPKREPGPIRIVGISTTAMTLTKERFSTSDNLLDEALAHAKSIGCDTRLVKLRELQFRPCEGFYSKSARACTWPCSITQMDPDDQLDQVYEAFVHWADVYLIATPIRWGAASSLYFKMVERMNCIQNQETIAGKHLLENKTAGFIITGGQDNVQGTAGQMLGFFAELGVQFPQFPYIAHSRGWSAEDMENNQRAVAESESLREGARALVDRCCAMARLMIDGTLVERAHVRGGRKAHRAGPRE